MFKTPPTWNNACLDTAQTAALFQSPWEVANGLTGIKSTLVKSLFIFNCSLLLELFSIPTDKNLKDWGQHILGLYLKNHLWTYTDNNFSLVLV